MTAMLRSTVATEVTRSSLDAATREILDVLAPDAPAPSDRDAGDHSGIDTRVRIVGCPARDEEDVLALEMVRHLLYPAQ